MLLARGTLTILILRCAAICYKINLGHMRCKIYILSGSRVRYCERDAVTVEPIVLADRS